MLLKTAREEANKIGMSLEGFKFTKQQFEEVYGADMLKACLNGNQKNPIPRPKILLEETSGAIFKNKAWDQLFRLIESLIKILDESKYPVDEFDFEFEFQFRDGITFVLRIKDYNAARKLGLKTENGLKDPLPEMINYEIREKIKHTSKN